MRVRARVCDLGAVEGGSVIEEEGVCVCDRGVCVVRSSN